MGNKKSAAEKLTVEQVNKIIAYFKTHTFASTLRHFNLTRSALNILFKKYDIAQHSNTEAELLKHFELDGYDKFNTRQIEDICAKYIELGDITDACIACGIKKYFLDYLIQQQNLPILHKKRKHTNIYIRQAKWYLNMPKEQLQEIIRYYLEPNTIVDTASHFGLTTYQINYLITKQGLEKHSTSITEKLGKAKQKQNLINKYGVTNVFQLDTVKQKSCETKEARYGDCHFTNREAAKVTCLAKYGAESFLGSEQGKEEIKKYSQEHYGTDYAFLSSIWQNNEEKKHKAVKTKSAKKYTAANYSSKYLSLVSNLPALTEYVKDKTIHEIAADLEISRDHAYYLLYKNNLLGLINKISQHSHYEAELVAFIGEENCICGDRTQLDGQEIDIYIPDKKIGIEFNGTYWHSSLNQPDRNYHFNKSRLAESKGIRLIHIWEYEWCDPIMQEKLKLMLNIALGRAENRIYARHCTIRCISNKEAKVLNDKVHLQGHRNAQVTYGLFYKDSLVQLMSFSKTKYNRNLKHDNSWEIIRGCPGSNNIVIGGVSKLIKHFISDYKPSIIFSYCDFNKFNGNSYEQIGMSFIGYTGPDMKWIINDFRQVVNRQPAKHKELVTKADAQIFGAGSKKYILNLSKV